VELIRSISWEVWLVLSRRDELSRLSDKNAGVWPEKTCNCGGLSQPSMVTRLQGWWVV